MADSEAPKLIIDSDWKAQAQAEKERLSTSVQAGAKADAGKTGKDVPHEATFLELVRMLTTQALLYMGAFPDPETGRAMIAPELARFHIDLLGILEAKTKGNLTDEESKALTQTVHELRLEFVELSKAVERAIAEGRIKRGAVPKGPEIGPIQ